MLRRLTICLSLACVLVTSRQTQAIGPGMGGPVTPITGGDFRGLNIKTQLQIGLRARRPVEFKYIDEIVKLIDDGKLPRQLVLTTFLAAQRQPTRQLQYFQFALLARTQHLDVRLPDLRLQAVGIGSNFGKNGVNGMTAPPVSVR